MKKIYLLYILLALGILLLSSGAWLFFSSTQVKRHVTIPDSTPVIAEELDFIMRGQFEYLFIWENGEVVYIRETGLRIPTKENPPTRIWKTGQIQQDEMNSLLEFFKNSGFETLDTYYQVAGQLVESAGSKSVVLTRSGDMKFNVSVDYADLSKTVSAFGYLTSDQGETYPDMPYPLNEIYEKLKDIADSTEEVAREKIS